MAVSAANSGVGDLKLLLGAYTSKLAVDLRIILGHDHRQLHPLTSVINHGWLPLAETEVLHLSVTWLKLGQVYHLWLAVCDTMLVRHVLWLSRFEFFLNLVLECHP